ncbi:hypothetical protein [Pantoea rodasii]|uniref:hypothetical protein n=1 Tax=Pantoea rodasii TaxID=1076549 RepID=UPI001FCD0C0E|nr:hypothetical protein [Pantoea rodasii]
MRVLIAADEHAWGGLIPSIRQTLPDVEFVASAGHAAESLAGFDALIPGMCRVDARLIATADRLKLVQQAGVGLEGVDLDAAKKPALWWRMFPPTIQAMRIRLPSWVSG